LFGFNLDSDEKIEDAIKNLGGTFVTHLEPNIITCPLKPYQALHRILNGLSKDHLLAIFRLRPYYI